MHDGKPPHFAHAGYLQPPHQSELEPWIVQPLSTVATAAAEAACTPFMNQIATVPPLAVAPENVALAVAVEVAGLDDQPVGGHRAEGPGLCHDPAVHQPDRHVAAAVAPEDVALAVAVEVAGSDDAPVGGHRGGETCGFDLHAVHEPDRHAAVTKVAPENVARGRRR